MSWKPPANDGGAVVKNYIIQKRETSRLTWTVVSSEVQMLSYKITKLLKNNEYIFRVMAESKFGIGLALESEPVMAKNQFSVPQPPSAPKVTILTEKFILELMFTLF